MMHNDEEIKSALKRLNNSLQDLPLSLRWQLKKTRRSGLARRRIMNLRFSKSHSLFNNFQGIRKKSDTLFVLGSGPSLNDISREQWGLIRKNDSWGFNHSFLHPHVPDVLFLQYAPFSSVKSPRPLELLFPFFQEQYKEKTIVFKGGVLDNKRNLSGKLFEMLSENGHSKIGLLPVFNPASVFFELGTSDTVKWLLKSGFINYGQGFASPSIQVRNTLGLILTLAANHGFKNVVLCGFDGQDNQHFYDKISYPSQLKGGLDLLLRRQDQRQAQLGGHPHNVITTSGVTSNDIVCEFMMLLNNNFGMKFYRGSESESFAPVLPSYWGFSH